MQKVLQRGRCGWGKTGAPASKPKTHLRLHHRGTLGHSSLQKTHVDNVSAVSQKQYPETQPSAESWPYCCASVGA
jgi:hypothetical protein